MISLMAVVSPSPTGPLRTDPGGACSVLLLLGLVSALYQEISGRIQAELAGVWDRARAVPPIPPGGAPPDPLLPSRRTVVLLVSGFHAFGVRALLALWNSFPEGFPQILFLAIGPAAGDPRLRAYCRIAGLMGMAAGLRVAAGEDPALAAERDCLRIAESFASVVFAAGRLRLRPRRWYHRFLRDLPEDVLDRVRLRGLPFANLPVDG